VYPLSFAVKARLSNAEHKCGGVLICSGFAQCVQNGATLDFREPDKFIPIGGKEQNRGIAPTDLSDQLVE
jgi:hypothetical protein